MNNLVVRAIAGVVFTIVVIGSAWLGALAVGLLFLFFASVGLYEMYELLRHKESHAPRWFGGMSLGVLIYLLLFLVATDTINPAWLWVVALFIAIMFCLELLRLDPDAVTHLALTAFGWIYVILPFSMVNFLGFIQGDFQYEIPMGYFLILWANDTGAYLVGRFFGKHKLYAKISPNKTWEGFFGGVALAFIVAIVLPHFFYSLKPNHWLAMALIIAIFGNLGDLFESQLKRNFAIKDSGHIIPGHGGILDRFDGLLLSLPVVLCYFKIIDFL